MRKMLGWGLAASMPVALLAQVPEEAPPASVAAKVQAATAAAEAGGQGPFPAEMVADLSLPTHTIYRSRNLAVASRAGRLPIVAWANGACHNLGNRFRYFLTEVASHGYLVLAIGPIGPRAVEWKLDLDPDGPAPAERPPRSYAQQLTDAIDWAIAENARKGSPYYRRLDPEAVAVMGQSCGGLQAISAAADRRVKTAVIWNSGTFAPTAKPLPGSADANKASLRRIRVPVAWISGDASDVAFPNANDDFAAFSTGPALRVWHAGTGHSEHWRELRGGLFTPLAIDWLDWQLKGKRAAAATFVGPECRLCRTRGWTVQSKGFR